MMGNKGIFEKTKGAVTVPVKESVGMALAHDITEIRKGEFKGRAFKKGYIIKREDIDHLRNLGKEHLYVLKIDGESIHEDEAALALAKSLMGNGVEMESEAKEGKINIVASIDGLLKIHKEALKAFNMLGEIMCATIHTNTVVKKGQVLAATRAIPLLIRIELLQKAVTIAEEVREQKIDNMIQSTSNGVSGVIEVRALKKPKVGLVITGNEIYHGRIKDAFEPVISNKIKAYNGEIVKTYFSPDAPVFIENRLRELINAGVDMLITTGGMSVDPDDVTRYAIRELGVRELHYGSAVLPGAMFLIAYIERTEERGQKSEDRKQKTKDDGRSTKDKEKRTLYKYHQASSKVIPILGIPACGMYSKITVFDLILPRILAGEHIGREEIAEMGHGGYCLNCKECRYPICPFGK